MHRQTIRTFYGVKDGVVKVIHTDPVLTPRKALAGNAGREAGRNAKSSADH